MVSTRSARRHENSAVGGAPSQASPTPSHASAASRPQSSSMMTRSRSRKANPNVLEENSHLKFETPSKPRRTPRARRKHSEARSTASKPIINQPEIKPKEAVALHERFGTETVQNSTAADQTASNKDAKDNDEWSVTFGADDVSDAEAKTAQPTLEPADFLTVEVAPEIVPPAADDVEKPAVANENVDATSDGRGTKAESRSAKDLQPNASEVGKVESAVHSELIVNAGKAVGEVQQLPTVNADVPEKITEKAGSSNTGKVSAKLVTADITMGDEAPSTKVDVKSSGVKNGTESLIAKPQPPKSDNKTEQPVSSGKNAGLRKRERQVFKREVSDEKKASDEPKLSTVVAKSIEAKLPPVNKVAAITSAGKDVEMTAEESKSVTGDIAINDEVPPAVNLESGGAAKATRKDGAESAITKPETPKTGDATNRPISSGKKTRSSMKEQQSRKKESTTGSAAAAPSLLTAVVKPVEAKPAPLNKVTASTSTSKDVEMTVDESKTATGDVAIGDEVRPTAVSLESGGVAKAAGKDGTDSTTENLKTPKQDDATARPISSGKKTRSSKKERQARKKESTTGSAAAAPSLSTPVVKPVQAKPAPVKKVAVSASASKDVKMTAEESKSATGDVNIIDKVPPAINAESGGVPKAAGKDGTDSTTGKPETPKTADATNRPISSGKKTRSTKKERLTRKKESMAGSTVDGPKLSIHVAKPIEGKPAPLKVTANTSASKDVKMTAEESKSVTGDVAIDDEVPLAVNSESGGVAKAAGMDVTDSTTGNPETPKTDDATILPISSGKKTRSSKKERLARKKESIAGSAVDLPKLRTPIAKSVKSKPAPVNKVTASASSNKKDGDADSGERKALIAGTTAGNKARQAAVGLDGDGTGRNGVEIDIGKDTSKSSDATDRPISSEKESRSLRRNQQSARKGQSIAKEKMESLKVSTLAKSAEDKPTTIVKAVGDVSAAKKDFKASGEEVKSSARQTKINVEAFSDTADVKSPEDTKASATKAADVSIRRETSKSGDATDQPVSSDKNARPLTKKERKARRKESIAGSMAEANKLSTPIAKSIGKKPIVVSAAATSSASKKDVEVAAKDGQKDKNVLTASKDREVSVKASSSKDPPLTKKERKARRRKSMAEASKPSKPGTKTGEIKASAAANTSQKASKSKKDVEATAEACQKDMDTIMGDSKAEDIAKVEKNVGSKKGVKSRHTTKVLERTVSAKKVGEIAADDESDLNQTTVGVEVVTSTNEVEVEEGGIQNKDSVPITPDDTERHEDANKGIEGNKNKKSVISHGETQEVDVISKEKSSSDGKVSVYVDNSVVVNKKRAMIVDGIDGEQGSADNLESVAKKVKTTPEEHATKEEGIDSHAPLAKPSPSPPTHQVDTEEEVAKISQEFFEFAQNNISSFIRRESSTSQLCRAAIKDLFHQQSVVEFGKSVSAYQFGPIRNAGLLPLGPILKLEAGQEVDSDQLWEEIELRNKPFLAHAHKRLTHLSELYESQQKSEAAVPETPKSDMEEQNQPNLSVEESSDDDINEEAEEDNEKSAKRRVRFAANLEDDLMANDERNIDEASGKEPDIEDGFFNISDMEKFAEDAEQLAESGKLMASDDESDDEGLLDGKGPVDNDASRTGMQEKLRYADFFDPPSAESAAGGKMAHISNLLDAEETEEDGTAPTPLTLSRAKMRKTIEAIEEENVGKKPWQLRGEVSGHSRPKDSLLDTTMEHDIAAKPKTVVDPEVSRDIEQVIRQRIADGLFDDVIKALPEEYEAEKRSKSDKPLPEVSQEKPTEGLGDLYAREYMEEKNKQVESNAASKEVQKETEAPETEEQVEVNRLFERLSKKLDALSSLHFTPTSAKYSTEMVVSSNVKALAAEEAIPDAVSDGNLLAPREVYTADKNAMVGEKERTKSEKNRKRRKTKSGIRKEKHAKVGKEQILAQTDPEEAAKRKAENVLARRGKKIRPTKGKASVTQFERPGEDNVPIGMKQKAGAKVMAAEMDDVSRKPAAHHIL